MKLCDSLISSLLNVEPSYIYSKFVIPNDDDNDDAIECTSLAAFISTFAEKHRRFRCKSWWSCFLYDIISQWTSSTTVVNERIYRNETSIVIGLNHKRLFTSNAIVCN
jgi:hypothetical protein